MRANDATGPTPLSQEAVLGLFESCSNAGRWGAGDERGTLNYITPAKRLEAAALVVRGETVSLGRDLPTRPQQGERPLAFHAMTYGGHAPISAHDLLVVMPHGFQVTHFDAVAHTYFEDCIYNGRRCAETITADGVTFGSIMAARDGVFTRGVFLDVASARGVEYLRRTDGISVADLEAAERLTGTYVGAGDAIFLRSGRELRTKREGGEGDEVREGILAEVVPWLHARQVAVYSGDCIEQMPSGYPRVPMPLHQVGLVAMGLMMLDCTDMEVLKAACARFGRATFLLTAAPLRLPGGTGSPVNPLAIF